jgi:hypothetical protein
MYTSFFQREPQPQALHSEADRTPGTDSEDFILLHGICIFSYAVLTGVPVPIMAYKTNIVAEIL